ncbi:hypothetical protein HIM_10724 [Hirsutella minnesotensis 3608]|uniref:Aminoglycoside phosphotransferase domain-containing protein n=1 Tax=Hirsutella minnesotensis 3608 TaxID=1043627 RepID=A0A0F7ZFX3_9HYPO|nr:hypothetical protein HIM_10724 [Hirsutella minnesotensis 3608]
MDICHDAKAVFNNLAPVTLYLGTVDGIAATTSTNNEPRLYIYLQEKLPGVALAGVQGQSLGQRSRLIQDVARVFAVSYHQRRSSGDKGAKERGELVKGRVGSSLRWRLRLVEGLPGEQLARHVSTVAEHLDSIEELPWCLTHGDLVPGNVLIDPESGQLTGLVDWAEGEWLPLGVGLYGLEELLGRNVSGQGFEYFDDHEELRQLFWDKFLGFCKFNPRSSVELKIMDDIALARKLGILLWRGIAFDDGSIDRVVEAGRDDAELSKLSLFLGVADPLTRGPAYAGCGAAKADGHI